MGFCVQERAASLQRMSERPLDLLVVGGGINGAGIARDAALRGLSVGLVEKGDWGSGTSSRSSRLIHGGLRYLENYEFGLVRESTLERARLTKLAGHLVRPLPFIYPLYEGDKPGPLLMRLGMTLYDLLASFRSYRWHRKLSTQRLGQVEPSLTTDRLRGAFLYYDCITDDGRVTLENVQDAAANGAECVNYVRFVRPVMEDGVVAGAELEDRLTGATLTVRTKLLVNAVGPWMNSVRERLDGAAAPRLVPSKGVHIVVPQTRLPVEHAVVMSAVADGRVVFCVPWGCATYIGTTDTAYEGSPDAVHADADDVRYLLDTANRYFPEQRLTDEDVISTWAGLRPLVEDEKASDSTYATSREHVVTADPRGVVSVAGGKLTTYRTMVAEVVDAAVRLLRAREPERSIGASATAKRPLPGGVGLACEQARDRLQTELTARLAQQLPAGLDGAECAATHLLQKYGRRAAAVLEAGEALGSVGVEPLMPGLPYLRAELDFAAREEQVVHLDDFLVRRTHAFYKAPDLAWSIARPVAERLAELLSWSPERVDEEVERYGALIDAHVACVGRDRHRPHAPQAIAARPPER